MPSGVADQTPLFCRRNQRHVLPFPAAGGEGESSGIAEFDLFPGFHLENARMITDGIEKSGEHFTVQMQIAAAALRAQPAGEAIIGGISYGGIHCHQRRGKFPMGE